MLLSSYSDESDTLQTKFQVSIFNRPQDMEGVPKFHKYPTCDRRLYNALAHRLSELSIAALTTASARRTMSKLQRTLYRSKAPAPSTHTHRRQSICVCNSICPLVTPVNCVESEQEAQLSQR